MLPSASDLKFFLEVAHTLNMSRAAERVGISQPALSQAIKRLEHSFGQDLLLRGKSGVSLTKAGERLAHNAKSLLEQWEQLRNEALINEKEVSGRYTLGMHPSVALYTLSHFVPQLLQKYPKLQLHFVHDLSRRITEDIVSFKVDFGIVVNPIAHPDLVITELFSDEVSFWRSKKKTKANDIDEEECVLLMEPDLLQTQDLLRRLPKKKNQFSRTMTSSNLEVIKKLTLNSCGIGIIPNRVVGEESKKMEQLENFPTFIDRICLIYRADMQKGQASKAIIHFIRDKLSIAEKRK